MTGSEVFEHLSKMTEQERMNCFFPFYYESGSYDRLKRNAASYIASNDEIGDKVMEIEDGQVAELLNQKFDDFCEELGGLTSDIEDDVMRELCEMA